MSKSVRVTKLFSNEREIVVGVDGSEHSNDAVTWAVREAKKREAVLRAVCVAPIWSDIELDWTVDNSLTESQETVDRAVQAAEALEPTVVVRGEVLAGPVAQTLIGASEVNDLLVLGPRGVGAMRELLLGSVSRSCVSDARCPIVIVYGPAQSNIQRPTARIVVGVGKEDDSDALNWAIEEADLRPASIEAVFDCATASDTDEASLSVHEREQLTSEFKRFTWSYDHPGVTGTLLASGVRYVSSVEALLEICRDADLLVLSQIDLEDNHKWTRGSILRRCVRKAPCPVVIVPPSTFFRATHPGLLTSNT
jgi:nucleotide-binding universal stress UspA family protein